jgi:hypothetical protein
VRALTAPRHGKVGDDGSSPPEGFPLSPAERIFLLSVAAGGSRSGCQPSVRAYVRIWRTGAVSWRTDSPPVGRAMVSTVSLDRTEVGRGVYRVEIGKDAGERIFTVVGPSGARLYSYTSPER